MNAKPLYKGHYQPRIPLNKEKYLGNYDINKIEVIKRQVQLAKRHGIYGFGIYYYWISGNILFEQILNIFFLNKDINFPYLLIWKNDLSFSKKKLQKKNEIDFIEDIKKYLIDSRYIKINKKPVIGIFNPLKINELDKLITIWREKSRQIGIGEIFILGNINEIIIKKFTEIHMFDAVYEFPPMNLFSNNLTKNEYFFYYSEIIYKINNILYNFTDDRPIYRGSMLQWDNSSYTGDNFYIFNEYSPEKFYILNKLIISWTRRHYKNNKFIIINSWNNWKEGSYLEPDNKYGYSNLNALSKAIFDLPFKLNNNFSILLNMSNIAVQAHIYYDDLIKEIIDKTNNIQSIFDLYITTDSLNKMLKIENYLKNFSKAKKYYIKIIENKGRDILPFLTQFKFIIKRYKYVCHIHSKKTLYLPEYGDKWRRYLYDNLLGNSEIISEILFDFENNDKLGFIYPETFYECIKFAINLNNDDKKNMNFILNEIFPGYKIGKNLEFPAGDMFWARVNAIYQIFEQKLEKMFPNEENQKIGTIMHGIERIWIYLVKLNGFYYKKIFKQI